jgi:DNA polymerase (family 10)
MAVQNSDVKDLFNKVADLLEIEGANPFRVRAYRNAARSISGLTRNVSEMVRKGQDITGVAGIGKDLAGKIREIVETGRLAQLEELEKKSPGALQELMAVQTLGPKRVKVLHRELGINNLDELRDAAEKGKIRDLEGFGEKTEQNILQGLKWKETQGKQIKLFDAERQAEPLVAYLKKSRGVSEIIVAGSFRRRQETVGDLDILVTADKDGDLMARLVDYEGIRNVLSRGGTRSTVVLRSGLQVDIRLVPQVSYGAALHYFTGSKSHNIAIRKLGVRKGYKINEYGVFQGENRVAGKTEKEVYQQVGLAYIEPELREYRGEVEAAQQDKLPQLVRRENLRGDLHSHTRASDGRSSLEDMAQAARERGYEYLAITEHSRRVSVANGLDPKRLKKQVKQIDALNEKIEDITLLKGIEVDILEDGSLDLPDDVLGKLDLTVCSVHYYRNLSRRKQTDRIVRAMSNPHFNILAHPTGRLINEREAYDVDLEEVMQAAADLGCFLELNSHPDRLDLSDRYCRMARDMRVKVAISTDAHSAEELDLLRFGVGQARRGWLESEDVLNTRSLKQLKKLLKRQ